MRVCTRFLHKMKSIIFTILVVLLLAATALATTETPSTTTSTPSPVSPASTSSSEYTNYAATGSEYKVHEVPLGWDGANETCVNEGANLLVVNDAVEADVVAQMMMDRGIYWSWTGVRGIRPGKVDYNNIEEEITTEMFHEMLHGRSSKNTYLSCSCFNSDAKRLYDYPCVAFFYLHFVCERSPQ